MQDTVLSPQTTSLRTDTRSFLWRCARYVLFLCSCSLLHADALEKTVAIVSWIHNGDATIDPFLSRIAQIDYDRQAISLTFEVVASSDETWSKIQKWCDANKNTYAALEVHRHSDNPSSPGGAQHALAALKSETLAREHNTDFLFLISSHEFILPHTLKHLVQQDHPIISPMLRPIPVPGDAFRNFFTASTNSGYYLFSANDGPIANRSLLCTAPVDVSLGPYLIKSEYAPSLTFDNAAHEWDFIVFSRSAKERGIPIRICNEREFGNFIHADLRNVASDPTFPYAALEKRVSTIDLIRITGPYYAGDPTFASYCQNIPIDRYSVYGADNKLYWVDEQWDLIKSGYLKQCKPWEADLQTLFAKYIRTGSTVLDVGGHVGSHSIFCSERVGPSGRVYTFEPQAKMFAELLVNLDLNQCRNVTPYRCGLGAQAMDAKILQPNRANEGHSLITPSGTEQVRIKPLDQFDLRDISFIKIDVEGYEYEVLQGGRETILRERPVMVIEIFQGPRYATTMSYLNELGYDVTPCSNDNDYLCIPRNSN